MKCDICSKEFKPTDAVTPSKLIPGQIRHATAICCSINCARHFLDGTDGKGCSTCGYSIEDWVYIGGHPDFPCTSCKYNPHMTDNWIPQLEIGEEV